MISRQLRFPGIDRREDEWVTARRDLSARAFFRAITRNGFHILPNRIEFADEAGRRYAAVCWTDPIRPRRRATLAKIIRERDGLTPLPVRTKPVSLALLGRNPP